MTVLILAGTSGKLTDGHALLVAEKIWARGGEAIFVDCASGTRFQLSMNVRGQAAIVVDSRDVGNVSRVWNRAKILLELVATPEQREEFLRRTEWSSAYRAITEHFAGRVVNDPAAHTRCDQKTEQQRIAARCGFPVPPTLITNSRAAALGFADEHGELICKAVGNPNIPYNQAFGGIAVMITCAVDREDIAAYSDEEFARSVTMLQQRIAKKWEYRVSAVGGKLFPFRIHSQELDYTKIDSSLGHAVMRHEFITLPENIEQALFAFLDAMGLWQGQFDLIEDPDGKIWFVECNPNGQWLWLDEFVDGALSDWYAEALLAPMPSRPSPGQRSPRDLASV